MNLKKINQQYGENYLSKKGLWEWFRSVDHKRIGVLYLISGLIAFFVGGIFALLLRTELIAPGQTIMDAQTYNIVFYLAWHHHDIFVYCAGDYCLFRELSFANYGWST